MWGSSKPPRASPLNILYALVYWLVMCTLYIIWLNGYVHTLHYLVEFREVISCHMPRSLHLASVWCANPFVCCHFILKSWLGLRFITLAWFGPHQQERSVAVFYRQLNKRGVIYPTILSTECCYQNLSWVLFCISKVPNFKISALTPINPYQKWVLFHKKILPYYSIYIT